MIKKIKFYRGLLIELIETMCTISIVMYKIAQRNHIPEGEYMYSHIRELKGYSEILRRKQK